MVSHNCLSFHLVLTISFCSVPFPGPLPKKPPCHREKSSVARKVFTKRWAPILEKAGVSTTIQCPFHPSRNIFASQETGKSRKGISWECGFCGQSFESENELDFHFEEAHSEIQNKVEDSICLADYCDIMRCDVMSVRMSELEQDTTETDKQSLDIWHKSFLFTYPKSKNAVEMSGSRSLSETPKPPWKWKTVPPTLKPQKKPPLDPDLEDPENELTQSASHLQTSASQSSDDVEKISEEESHNEEKTNEEKAENINKHAFVSYANNNEIKEPQEEGPTEVPLQPLHSWKDSCNDENLAESRAKCQQIIQQCISGLVLNLTLEEIKTVEDALYRSTCWYLTCDRYWESEAPVTNDFPWGILASFVALLSLGVSICYYIVWVAFTPARDSNIFTPINRDHKFFESAKEAKSAQTIDDQKYASDRHCAQSLALSEQKLPLINKDLTLGHLDYQGVIAKTQSLKRVSRTNTKKFYGNLDEALGESEKNPNKRSFVKRRRPFSAEIESVVLPETKTLSLSRAAGGKRRPHSDMNSDLRDPNSAIYALNRPEIERRRVPPSDVDSEFRDSGFNEGGILPEFEAQDYTPSESYRSRHHSEESRFSLPQEDSIHQPNAYLREERVYNYATSFTPNYELRRLRRNRYNYLDDFEMFSDVDVDAGESGRERSDSFIYVSYAPGVKEKFLQNS